jgi:hypothetical protein
MKLKAGRRALSRPSPRLLRKPDSSSGPLKTHSPLPEFLSPDTITRPDARVFLPF